MTGEEFDALDADVVFKGDEMTSIFAAVEMVLEGYEGRSNPAIEALRRVRDKCSVWRQGLPNLDREESA